MIKPAFLAIPAISALVACTPPPDVPPPYFQPDPPYAPKPVDPYLQGLMSSPDVASVQQPDLQVPSLPRMDEPTATNPPAPSQVRPKDYPTATKTDRPNVVVSPYAPHREIDVSDFRSGQLARDPKTREIFKVP
jgi:hypothetical protein